MSYTAILIYWSAGILPASGTSASIQNSKSLPPEKRNTNAGKMPALQTLVAHGGVSRAGKMPALQ
jgi:hypothetical protein